MENGEMKLLNLEKNYAPKTISPFFKDVKRVPRKFKKKWKHILCGSRYNH